MNQVALYLNLAAKRVHESRNLSFLTGNNAIAMGAGGLGQETQIMFVRNALWIANNDDADTRLQKSLLDRLGINTVDALIDHVDTYQGRVFGRRRQGGVDVYENRASPTERLLFELAGYEEDGSARAAGVPYAANLVPPVRGVANPTYTIQGAAARRAEPPVNGIVFVLGNYDADEATRAAVNEHAEQKLLAALSSVPDAIRGTLALYGCKRACNVCARVLTAADARLRQERRYLNTRSHDDAHVENYQAQFHAENIKALDVAAYFP